MKRWSLVLLLLLLPLTLAPRTSLNPGAPTLELTAVVSQTDVRPGTPVNYVLQARNVSASTLERQVVEILVGWDGKTDDLVLTGSSACDIVYDQFLGYIASCALGDLDPGEQVTVRLQARPLSTGTIIFDVLSLSVLGPVPGDETVTVHVR